MGLIIWGVVLSSVVGAAVMLVAPRFGDQYRITGREFAMGVAACTFVIVPFTTIVGTNVARSNNLSFNEYWNGWETDATRETIPCQRDGSCRHTYDCDRYTVTVTKTRSVSDGKGGTKSETYTDTEVRYHSCPYVTAEYTYKVATDFDEHTIASHRMPENPEANRWRPYEPIPDWVERRAGIGAPAQWTAVRDRLDAGTPGPVTVVRSYDNFILASQYSTLRRLSGDIDQFTAEGLIPDPASGIREKTLYRADKTHLVDLSGESERDWSMAVDRLSSALGSERQGDLQLVAVPADKVGKPDSYTEALMASWSSPERGDNAVAKNAVVLVVGVENDKVTWARLATGMPVGNERVADEVQEALPGTKFSPDELLGAATVRTVKGEQVTDVGDSEFAAILFDKDAGFVRACMLTCEEGQDGSGFGYLSGEIRPDTGQMIWILLFSTLLASGVWAAFAYYAVAGHHGDTPADIPTHRRVGGTPGRNSKR